MLQDMIRRNVLVALGEVEGIHLLGENVHAEPTTNQSIPAEPLCKHDFFQLSQKRFRTFLRLVRKECDRCRDRMMPDADVECRSAGDVSLEEPNLTQSNENGLHRRERANGTRLSSFRLVIERSVDNQGETHTERTRRLGRLCTRSQCSYGTSGYSSLSA